MNLSDKARTVPRIHLIGTLTIVSVLTVLLGSFFAWQNLVDQQKSIERLEEAISRQLVERLQAEMALALDFVEFTRAGTEALLRQELVEQVDQAMAIAEGIYRSASGHHPPEVVQRLIVEALRPVRFFDGRGYYFIDDMTGRFILLPTAPHLEGRLMPDNQDDTGHFIMRGLIEAARKPKEQSFSRYRWYRPDDPQHMADKLAYVRHFPPFDWLIGTGDYIHEWEARQQRAVLTRLRSQRFGDSGGFSVIDRDGRVLLSAEAPELEGKRLDDIPPSTAQLLRAFAELADSHQEVLRYEWPDRSAGATLPRLAFAQNIPEWGWTLIATVAEKALRDELSRERLDAEEVNGDRLLKFSAVIGIVLLIAMSASLLFSRWSHRLFRAYHEENAAQREALRQQAGKLRESEDRLATILDSVEAYIYIKDPQYRYRYANRRVRELFGRELDAIIGERDESFFDPDTARQLLENDKQVIEHGKRVAVEERSVLRDGGEARTFLSIKLPLRRDDGEIYALCGISTDITQRKRMEDEIRQLAFYDPLTGLANRRLLADRLQQQLLASARSGQYGALLFIDLDNFKTLNDTLGHDAGDLLLQQVAHRLGFCVRQGDTVARFGGDEFVCMLNDLGSSAAAAAAHAKTVGEKILELLRQPFRIHSRIHVSTPSIGITVFAGHQATVEDLLKQADMAMYQAKTAGRNGLRFFDPQMQARLQERATLESELRLALDAGQLSLYYQPQVDIDGRITGVEALLRWTHPQRGPVAPGDFIALAEETGLILPIGAWVLESACEQLRRWSAAPATAGWTVSVNVSALQFQQADFVDLVIDTLARHGANPHRLTLELTESMVHDIDHTLPRMHALKAHGIRFSLDDFGTGYSSLAYLKRLPLDELKIDRSFVRDLLTDPNDALIAQTIVSLTRTLGLRVIAEGVETAAQRQALIAQGCLHFQGYLFSPPVPAERLTAGLEE
ncbi:MAG TPA: EAL domain-containing protein [Pseudothauera hydrothermalis]|nr:EAL domain-containing protein [Pseudothauera hydrothermalis]